MRKWIVGGAAALALAVTGTCFADATASAARRGDVLTFDVASDTSWGTVSYYNGGNILRQQHDFKLTEKGADGLYHRTVTFRSAVPQQILAVRMQVEGATAKCEIKVNGRVHSRGVAHGFRAAALCT